MKNSSQLNHSLSSDLDAASPSLRDVAAYLRGVADATAALSEPASPTVAGRLHVVIAPPEGLGATRETLAATAASRMMTLPYDGLDGATHTPPPRLTMGYPLDVLDSDTDIAPAPPGISDSWDDLVTGDAGEEHQSGVRLRVGQLSAEWYDLVGANVA